MTTEPSNPTNAEIRNQIEYSMKILVSVFDDKLMSLEATISNLNSKIEMLTQRIEFLERSQSSKSSFLPPKQDTKPKKEDKTSSSLSDALKLIED